jgi:hypothetical protein
MMDTVRTQPPPNDDGEDWVRQFALPEEYLLRHYPTACGSPYRRFESPNVIDLVRIRRQRAKERQSRL